MKHEPIKPSLASLIRAHRQASKREDQYYANIAEADPDDLQDIQIRDAVNDARDRIRVALMADCDLSKPDADYLMETIL